MKVCKNCQTEYQGNFCPNCGQKYIDRRFNLKDSILWFFNSIFNLDHGFLYTSKELLLHPGKVIHDVLNGITVRYTHPFRLLFIWATISTLMVISLGTFDESNETLSQGLQYSEAQLRMQAKINEIMKKYLSFFIMANVPLVSLFGLLLYRKKKLNFTEHMVVNSYGYVLTSAVGVLVTIGQYFSHAPGIFIWISLATNLLVMAYVYQSTFKENYFISLLKYFVAFVLGYLIPMTIFGVILGIYMAVSGKIEAPKETEEAVSQLLLHYDLLSPYGIFKA